MNTPFGVCLPTHPSGALRTKSPPTTGGLLVFRAFIRPNELPFASRIILLPLDVFRPPDDLQTPG